MFVMIKLQVIREQLEESMADNLPQTLMNLKRMQALEKWLKATNMRLVQVNGQRKYGGPPAGWDGPEPGPQCEVFISKIPRDVYEDILIPLFSSAGCLWEFRLMMNFSGQNRGFAYAKYATVTMADNAIRQLNNYRLASGCLLSVRCSTDKKHLSIRLLPATTKPEDLLKVLRQLVEGVDRVFLKGEHGKNGVSGIVAFTSHYAASMAKKVLTEEFKKQFLLHVSVKWYLVEKRGQDHWFSPKVPKRPLPSPMIPPRLRRALPTPLLIPNTVGRPTNPIPSHPKTAPCFVQGNVVSPVLVLQKLCETKGFGPPIYDLFYSHAGSDGFLYFAYIMHIPRAPSGFNGMVNILPGPSYCGTLEEAQKAVAQQVLFKVSCRQLAA